MVVITGSGVISPIGIGAAAFRSGLCSGACGIREVRRGDRTGPGAEVPGFSVAHYLESEKTYLDRAAAFALAACSLARREAEWEMAEGATEQAGIVLGTAYGCLDTLRAYYERVLERGAKFASSLLFSHSYANTPTSLAAIEYHLRGYHSTVCTGLTSGATALIQAVDALRDGRAERVLAGGLEALSEPLWQGLSAYLAPVRSDGAENDDKTSAARPGIVPGEGAGMFVLETAASATARGAVAQGRITGAGLARSSSLGTGDGLERGIRAALQEAEREAAEVDVVFAQANGWPAVDEEERAALRAVFPEGVPVTALKSRWGEPLGAGPALSLAAALSAFADGQIPATRPENLPVAADLDGVTAPRSAEVTVALITSIDFGGGCVSLVVER